MVKFLKSLFKSKPQKIVEVLPYGARFEVPGGQTLLESALQHDVPFPHNCTVGTCGSCKCRLKQGEVKAITDFGYTLSKQELDAGYILACQAVPRGDLTVVEVESGALDVPPPEKFIGRIVATEPLTHDILKVTLELDRPVRFVAGQYANIKSPNVPRARCYSFADAPERKGRSLVSFMVRKVPGGAFTEALFDGRLDDLQLEVDAPHGSFGLRSSAAPMVCIAGGSGLAPLLSLLEDARKSRVRRRCVLLFGARTQADLYALDQIKAIGGGWQDQFEFVPVLSAEPADSDWNGARGMVTEFIALSLSNADWAGIEGYLCGPPGMIDAAIGVMTALGVRLESIHYDKFTDESHAATMA
ncbi:MAG: 2Fe-2S iron-sulfur cluster binding domain-containing protein [Rhodocyclaceae bacterium]|jgi:p-cymene monooxygenase electron transfer component|nr:2Fe-2S iron-sulfur cluster binding domain-containing protein [Rhodocyclaceae bacterium]